MKKDEFAKLLKGNWVIHKKLPKKISKIVYDPKPNGAAYVKFENELEIASRNEIEPIPLDSQILVRNGFVNDKQHKLYSDNSGIDVCIEYNPELFVIKLEYKDPLKGPCNVHTLQNLYFELTGKELHINL